MAESKKSKENPYEFESLYNVRIYCIRIYVYVCTYTHGKTIKKSMRMVNKTFKRVALPWGPKGNGLRTRRPGSSEVLVELPLPPPGRLREVSASLLFFAVHTDTL